MKTKKAEKPVVESTELAPVAAKPLSKPAKVVKPVVKKVKAETAAVAKETVKETKIVKKPKLKVVRDSFTMPQSEYQKIADIKALCLKVSMPVKKSEVLRAGLKALCAMDETQLKNALNGLDKIKTGRPNKH